ncbi:MAG: YraN family protein [Ruminococcus sp.]|nr:YraN family protein [Ruminococcus sp.]
MNYKRIKGDKGEEFAVKFLKKNKCKIITRNFSCKSGEIDIIAENKEFILFVEVKTRQEGQMLEPRYSVDKKKQQRLLKTASYYMQSHKTSKQPRFDVAEVIVNNEGEMSINYLKNAFWQEGDYAVF